MTVSSLSSVSSHDLEKALARSRRRILAAASVVLTLSACDTPEQGEPEPSSFRTTRGDLEGLDDPIARWLRENMTDEGRIAVPYLDMLRQVAELQGCDASTIDSYVISDELLADEGTFPRVVNTVCSDDRTKSDEAFFALSFANTDATDLDPQRIEMFAWDPSERRYRFYKTTPAGGDTMDVEIDPPECRECHLTPNGVEDSFMPMTPIMNELAAPWEHWHAEPISVNHFVPEDLQQAPVFSSLAGHDSPFLKSAARLEQTIRSAFTQRIASSRIRTRRNKPADVDQSMALLRPLFCDEQLTYVTEDGSSGLLAGGTVLDDGFHSVFFQIRGTDWPWEWWNDRQIRLQADPADPIDMHAVRGASVVAYEKQMLATRALDPLQVLAVRALDWHEPALSQFRCDLWHAALPRVRETPPAIDDGTRNLHILEPLLDEILTLHPADFELGDDLPESVSLRTQSEGSVLMLARADTANLRSLVQAIGSDSVGLSTCGAEGSGFCIATPEELGDLLERRFKAVEAAGRPALRENRDRRGCEAQRRFPNAPDIPGVGCRE